MALILSAAMLLQSWCSEGFTITGYVRGAHSPYTYDGTSIWTAEPIAAASWSIPIDSTVVVQGLGAYRVADRGGGLGPAHIDVAVWTLAEALATTRLAAVCIYPPGAGGG